MQGFLSRWKPNDGEKIIAMGNWKESRVEAVGTYRLVLDTGFILDLHNVFLVPEISRNLISFSKLVHDGFEFNFGQNFVRISRNECLIENGYLCSGWYR